jgi:hypothetical protein
MRIESEQLAFVSPRDENSVNHAIQLKISIDLTALLRINLLIFIGILYFIKRIETRNFISKN